MQQPKSEYEIDLSELEGPPTRRLGADPLEVRLSEVDLEAIDELLELGPGGLLEGFGGGPAR